MVKRIVMAFAVVMALSALTVSAQCSKARGCTFKATEDKVEAPKAECKKVEAKAETVAACSRKAACAEAKKCSKSCDKTKCALKEECTKKDGTCKVEGNRAACCQAKKAEAAK